MKLLDGPLIEKILYNFTDLYLTVNPEEYELTLNISKIYNRRTQNLFPCNQSSLDTRELVLQSLIKTYRSSEVDALNFPGIEGWEC